MVVCFILVDLLLKVFFFEVVVFYEMDEVMWLIMDCYDFVVFVVILMLIVGEFCEWLLLNELEGSDFINVVLVIMFEMVVVVLKLMCNQDLIVVV